MLGTTGVFGEEQDEECLVCFEIDQQSKITCSDCKRTLVHVHCAHGSDKCPFCRGANFSEKASKETQFLLTQYQRCEGPNSAVTILIELYNNNSKQELLKAVNSFDQILEESVGKLYGYVQRTIACISCIISNSSSRLLTTTINQYGLLEGSHPTCRKCLIPASDENLELLREIKKKGNFRNFEEITLKSRKGKGREGIFLEGALQIKKTRGNPFQIRGRICRSTDFDRIVSYLKEVEEMVI